MKWYSKLYISKSVGRKASKIRKKIEKNIPVKDIYVISLPSNPDNILDMIPTNNLLQELYPKDNVRIIGLAKGYDDGINLIKQIIDETYQATGTVEVAAYLKSKGKGKE